jgi:hypothetical protein
MCHVWETEEGPTGFLIGRPEEKRYILEDIGVNERVILKWIFKEYDGDAWTGLIWLKIGTDGGHLRVR